MKMEKVYKIAYWVFLVVSLLMIFEGVEIDSRYRDGFDSLFFKVNIWLPLLLFTIVRVFVKESITKFQYGLMISVVASMGFLFVKYFVLGEVLELSEFLSEFFLRD